MPLGTTDRTIAAASTRKNSMCDDDIQQQLTKALADRGVVPLCHVRVDVYDGVAILRGSVGRYYDKQLAQEVVKRIDGIDKLRNEIVVQ